MSSEPVKENWKVKRFEVDDLSGGLAGSALNVFVT